MDFEHSPRTQELLARLNAFQEHEINPREEPYHRELLSRTDPWVVLPVIEEIKAKAKRACGTYSSASEHYGAGLSNVEYAPLAEAPSGRSLITARCATATRPTRATWRCCCSSAPQEQEREALACSRCWMGSIRSAFCMTQCRGRLL